MEIIENATMLDGTEIRLEKWGNKFIIGAYPIAKNTGKYRWIEGGKKFRLTISENHYKDYTTDMVKNDFECLKSCLKTLQDLSSYFYNGKKDMWYLGMNVEYKEY